MVASLPVQELPQRVEYVKLDLLIPLLPFGKIVVWEEPALDLPDALGVEQVECFPGVAIR